MKVAILSPDCTEVVVLRKEYFDDDLLEALLDFSRMQKTNYIISDVYEKFGNWNVLLDIEEIQGTNLFHAIRFKDSGTIKEWCLINKWIKE